ncbi:nitrogen regulation protein NR(II) [Motiliproteus sp. SC1-56]|uniref:nitrogen regulation protein NR(II) n=1 Tax=Motiliproteus sp. SC1-56 TaxID=2799565 RepID=UPI001A8F465B|nr:nitrogen regulation protein NR(II) [Motiliproteus sp. SC1-56]
MVQKLYKQLLDNLSSAVLLLDRDRCLRYINPAGEMLFEISAKRVEGENIVGLVRDHAGFYQIIDDAVSAGHAFTRREAQLQLHSGRELVADYSVTPLAADQGGYLLLEIQPRDRLMRISREEDARAQQQTTRELIRGLAHEIKNPLGGIRGAAQLLDRALPDASLSDYTQVIIGEADRLQNLVDRMLGPRTMPKIQPLNIHLILERIYSLISAETDGKLEVIRDYDPSIPDVEGDEEQLIQAFLNVVRNAVQALTEGDVEAPRVILRTRAIRQFTLGTERHRLVCQIAIIDNGPGIPEALKEILFYPMISGRAEGTGLGLSIAQSVINQHSGLIECQSEPGCTEFLIYLPLEQKHANGN